MIALTIALGAIIFGFVPYWLLHPPSRENVREKAAKPVAERSVASAEFPNLTTPAGLVYPYSVIPGGAYSVQELRAALSLDRVAATHYADFNLWDARVVRLAEEKRFYVSYRIGNKIFWTKKKLRIAKGEMLLTDGAHSARTRCGNRLSELPLPQTSRLEPLEAAFNTPLPLQPLPALLPRLPELGSLVPVPGLPRLPGTTPGFPASTPGLPARPAPPATGISVPPPGEYLPLGPGPVPSGRIRKRRTGGPPPPGSYAAPPSVPAVPEPGTLLLLASGMGVLYVARRRKSKKTS